MNLLKNIFGKSISRRQITISIICLILGFGLVTQLRVQGKAGQRLSSQSESDLTEIIDKQDAEIRALRSEAGELEVQLARYETSSQDKNDIVKAAKTNLENMRILVGLDPVIGGGIDIEIRDKNKFLTGFDLRQLIEELRASGAQAIVVNDKRVVTSTSFSRRQGHIYLDDHRLRLPYRLQAIGDADVLYQSISLPRGVKDKLSAFEGVRLIIKKEGQLILPAVEK